MSTATIVMLRLVGAGVGASPMWALVRAEAQLAVTALLLRGILAAPATRRAVRAADAEHRVVDVDVTPAEALALGGQDEATVRRIIGDLDNRVRVMLT